jgi:hypothetical protein
MIELFNENFTLEHHHHFFVWSSLNLLFIYYTFSPTKATTVITFLIALHSQITVTSNDDFTVEEITSIVIK